VQVRAANTPAIRPGATPHQYTPRLILHDHRAKAKRVGGNSQKVRKWRRSPSHHADPPSSKSGGEKLSPFRELRLPAADTDGNPRCRRSSSTLHRGRTLRDDELHRRWNNHVAPSDFSSHGGGEHGGVATGVRKAKSEERTATRASL
jgi:hypothetical protein